MANLNINIVIPQGSDFTKTFNSVESNGSATDLTGYSASASLKKHFDSNTSVDFSVSIVELSGQVSIALTSAQTSAIEFGRYYYDVVITSPTDVKTRLAEGMALVSPGVTL